MAQERYADVVFSNARVITMESRSPTAQFVAVKGDKILWVGSIEESRQFKGPHTKEIDCQDMALMPGFNDAHIHLLALASSLRGVDCRTDNAGSISQIVDEIGRRAQRCQTGEWVRAFGYDEFNLAEKRHPNRWDLDRATHAHPVRLDHRTGHASVVNSAALQLLQITKDTPDPPDGIIDRDGASGEPTGILFEMGDYIRIDGSRRNDVDLLEGIGLANDLLLSRGITSIQDASPGNAFHRWKFFHRLKDEGHLTPRVTIMAGASHLESFLDIGLLPGSHDEEPSVGAVKIMLTLTTGTLQPSQEELREIVLYAHQKGFQVAIHAVEEQAVEAAVDSLLSAQSAFPRPDTRHRIEHCSECPPHLVAKLGSSRALVVTQPSFIFHNGEKYLSEVVETTLPHLYPVGSLNEAGIPAAFSSDAPVAYPNPIMDIYSAVSRKTRGDRTLCSFQRIPVEAAIRMSSIGGAYASFKEQVTGSIAVGKLADLVLLNRDPTIVESENIKEIRAMMTVVGGEVAWQR